MAKICRKCATGRGKRQNASPGRPSTQTDARSQSGARSGRPEKTATFESRRLARPRGGPLLFSAAIVSRRDEGSFSMNVIAATLTQTASIKGLVVFIRAIGGKPVKTRG